jgi:hypothetical protein
VSATFVVAPDQRIAFVHVDADWRRRAEPADLPRCLEPFAKERS